MPFVATVLAFVPMVAILALPMLRLAMVVHRALHLLPVAATTITPTTTHITATHATTKYIGTPSLHAITTGLDSGSTVIVIGMTTM